MSSEEKKTESNDSNSETRIQSIGKRKKKKEPWEREKKKRAQKKLTLFRNSFFKFQTESRAKYTKVQVVLKQVYVGEVYEEHQKSYGKSCQHIAHSSKRIWVWKKSSSNWTFQIYYAMSYQCEYQNEVQRTL